MASNASIKHNLDNGSRIKQGLKLHRSMTKATDWRDKAMKAHELNCILSELGLGASLVVCNDSTLIEAGQMLDVLQAEALRNAKPSSATAHSYNGKGIVSVYSGKPGCACGCKGRHYYSTQHRVAEGAARGYPVSDAEVSDVMVTRIIKKLVKHRAFVEEGSSHFALEVGGRLYIAYFSSRPLYWE